MCSLETGSLWQSVESSVHNSVQNSRCQDWSCSLQLAFVCVFSPCEKVLSQKPATSAAAAAAGEAEPSGDEEDSKLASLTKESRAL